MPTSTESTWGRTARRRLALAVALSGTFLTGAACKREEPSPEKPNQPEVRLAKNVVQQPTPTAAVPNGASSSQAPSELPPQGADDADARCPDGMVFVAGSYCSSVVQNCLEYHPEYVQNPHGSTVSDRCLRYEKPSRCVGKRADMAFCMDRFEYPNRVGDKPRVLTSYLDAEKLCRAQNKRLCTEDEFNFACEGPESLPYATGYERDSAKCNYDREYRRPDLTRRMKKYDECPLDDHCKSELERLDQRHPIGSSLTCTSFAGVVDLNGNVNEWVTLPKEKPPNRSGLKGGWWGPVRDRCRPTVTFHKEEDYGYEAGFRCCADEGRAVSERP